MSDYLAIIQTNGIGSWARSSDKLKAVADVARLFRSDWRTILKPKQRPVKIPVLVYDVEGYDKVVWDATGMYGDGKKINPNVEVVEHTYAKW